MKTKTEKMNMNRKNLILIPVLITCLVLAPKAQAVVPAPGGGYPGGNTAEGQGALFSLTSGTYNTAIGLFSLRSNTEGNLNTGVGAGTLLLNAGEQNTATGAGALLSNATGFGNTANGAFALFSNTTGPSNTATGFHALFANTIGANNVAVGNSSLEANTTGTFNTALGFTALANNTTANGNTATGAGALGGNTNGSDNTANGAFALFNNTTGDANTAVGSSALGSNTTGFDNSAFGLQALTSNTVGTDNTAVGVVALKNNIGGFGNVAFGAAALFDNVSGELNVAVGHNAGRNLTGNDNVCIGSLVQGVAGESNTTRIKNIYTSVASDRAVFVNSDNKLGTLLSTRRVKEDIKAMDKTSEAILALKPVTFCYKKEVERSGAIQFGLIAEEVAEVSPDLVILDAAGEPESVRYEAINAMLLNEFIKEHKKVDEQQATITELKRDFQLASARQQKEIQILSAQLKEQAAQIQKVSAQIEVSKPTPRMAVRNP
jgi:hypothetical protein